MVQKLTSHEEHFEKYQSMTRELDKKRATRTHISDGKQSVKAASRDIMAGYKEAMRKARGG